MQLAHSRARALSLLAVSLAGFAGGAFPSTVRFIGWPEIPTCGYLVSLGLRLYDQIFFPHTPLLILLTAAAGSLFGFTPVTLRALAGLSLGGSAALLVMGSRPRRGGAAVLVPFLIGVPVLLLLCVWAGGPTLWPDPFLSPVLLGGVLLLERFERDAATRSIVAASLLLGTVVLIKQTAAAIPLAAVLWVALRSRHRGKRNVLIALAGALIPFATFAVVWGAVFRTTAHLRWTLLVPFQMAAAQENRAPLGWAELHEATPPFLAIVAITLAMAALPDAARRRSPAAWIGVATIGMAYPRADLLHLSAAHGVLTLLLVRSLLILVVFARRARKRSPRLTRTIVAAASAAVALTIIAVALLGGGAILLDRAGGPTDYWDDTRSRAWEAIARRRLHRGDEVVLLGIPWDTLYPRLGLRPVGNLYVNTSFWDCVNKEGADGRIVDALERHPGALIFFCDTDDPHVRATAIYRFITTRTTIVERINAATMWRRVPGRSDDSKPSPRAPQEGHEERRH